MFFFIFLFIQCNDRMHYIQKPQSNSAKLQVLFPAII